jgi:hypothetical protein
VVTAWLAASRSSTGAGVPSAAASSEPRKRLREAPEQHRRAEGDDAVERGEQLPVVRGGLGEAEAGVDDDAVGSTPAETRRSTPRASSRARR